MKILMTADAVGGVWTYAMELCASLSRHDVRIVLATMGRLPSEAQLGQAAAVRGLQLECSTYALEWMRDPWRDVDRAYDWLRGLADDREADLVHLNGYSHAAYEWRRPVLVVAHSCVQSWWHAVHGTAPPPEWDEYRRRVARGLDRADRVVAPTNAFMDELQRLYGVSADHCVIGNGCSGAERSSVEKQQMIFACGRAWDPAKNMSVLDRAVDGLRWPTYVAGDTSAPDGRRANLRAIEASFREPHT